MARPRPPYLIRKLSVDGAAARSRGRERATTFLNGQDNDNRAHTWGRWRVCAIASGRGEQLKTQQEFYHFHQYVPGEGAGIEEEEEDVQEYVPGEGALIEVLQPLNREEPKDIPYDGSLHDLEDEVMEEEEEDLEEDLEKDLEEDPEKALKKIRGENLQQWSKRIRKKILKKSRRKNKKRTKEWPSAG
ncbi:hypothetical protein PIB30_056297 [Stylosanthes scabra]|uniref:Uncharacterized protein n=1 Tax=Stylosanthes scabra TaxID=79078 RepID=A0ABU6XH73_9FABA|nr:hypothetical protein [Stylosanthes scabra]